MEGRRFSEGLHQAIEAKENVTVKEESQTLATITFQNYFACTKVGGNDRNRQDGRRGVSKIYDRTWWRFQPTATVDARTTRI